MQQGELLIQQSEGDTDAAEASLQQALHLAHHQQAKIWELQAATFLSRLWLQQGKRRQAYTLLAPLYLWFTEGLGTQDLCNAKTLLDSLRGL